MPQRHQQPGHPSFRRARLGLEALEDRSLPSTSPLTTPALSVGSTYSSNDILVQFKSNQPHSDLTGTSIGTQLSLVQNLYEINLSSGVTVNQALAAYRADSQVADAELDYTLSVAATPAATQFSQQWSLLNTGQNGGTPGDDIGATKAWNVTTGANSPIVAVLDTGIAYDHPDLYQNIWINQADIPDHWYVKSSDGAYDKIVYKSQIKTATPGIITFADLNNPANKGLLTDNNGDGLIDAGDILRPLSQGGWEQTGQTNDLIGWNYSGNNNNPMDQNGHGTNVAGIIGAMGTSGTQTSGVDPNALLMPVEFLDASGNGTISQYIEGLNYAVAHGAKIINNSWTGADPSTMLSDAIANAQAHGVIYVAAAGNSSSNNDNTPVYPANYSTSFNNVVSVAATDNNDHLASFSNYGAKSVTLAAPGVNIYNTLPNGQYGSMSGTSMATPEVAGVMALVWSEHPSWSDTQVINQVLSTVSKVSALQGKVATGGVLNAAAAVGYVSASSTTPHVESATASGPTPYSLNSIKVTFDEAINPATFTPSDVTLLGPNNRVAITSVSPVAGSGDTAFTISFATQTTPGTYTLYIGSAAKDMAGGSLAPYQKSLTVTAAPVAPHVVSAVPSGPTAYSMNSIKVTFDRAINPATFTAADVGLLGPNSKVAITGVSPVSGSGNTTFTISFATQTTPGTYTLYIGAAAKDMSGNALAPYSTALKVAAAPVSPSVASATASGPTPYSMNSIKVTFNQSINPATFTTGNVSLLGPKGRVAIASVVPVSGTSNKTFNVTFPTQTAAGMYTFYLGGAVKTTQGAQVTAYQTAFKVAAAPAPTIASYTSSTPVAINPGATAVSLLSVPESVTIGSVTVKLNVIYPEDRDLYIHLQGPDGTDVTLVNQLGGTSSNFTNTVFSDSASQSIGFAAGPFTGTYKPIVPLSSLAGRNSQGTWKLWVQDFGSHSGTLENWTVTINPKT